MNPYREERIAQVTGGDAADVDAAVKAAQQAQPKWQALGGAARAHYLDGFADALEFRREALIVLSATNNGKPLAEAGIDLDDAIACYRYYAKQAKRWMPGKGSGSVSKWKALKRVRITIRLG